MTLDSPQVDRLRSKFAYDFSGVRIYDDARSADAAHALGAAAFSVGSTVFLSSRARAESVAMRRDILAHELAHVAQHGQHSNTLHRKELTRSAYENTHSESDWIDDDVTNWRRDFNFPNPQQKNTFIEAAKFNTAHQHPEEYATIFQRSEYYAVIDFIGQRTGGSVGNVRFFSAASKVTSGSGVGAVEATAGSALHDDRTIRLLKAINVLLFASNMRIIAKLLNVAKKPTDPKDAASTTEIDALDFDLNLVEKEQGIVESYLLEHSSELVPEVVTDLNDDLNLNGFWRTIAEPLLDRLTFTWAKAALNVKTLDFLKIAHRIAIGRAAIFNLHGKSFDEYFRYMAAHPTSTAPLVPVGG